MKRYPHISTLLFDQPWAITPRALESLIARIEQLTPVDIEAIAERYGRPMENTGNRVEQRGSTAIIDIQGPIFRYANLMTALSGATSAEMLARDFRTAHDSSSVDQILLRVDSPGGEVHGISDLAEAIHAATKPVTAFVDGLGASAAYWLASAAKKIYGSADSFTGSIGVVATLTDKRAAQERQGVKTYQIVSSNAPRKLADPSTEEGRAAILEVIDSLGALFVGQVARFRGVQEDHVLAQFGRGLVVPARLAERAGMIDGITSEEALIASLNNRTLVAGFSAKEEPMSTATDPKQPEQPPANPPVQPPVQPANPPANPPAHQPVDPNASATAERARIQAILNLPEAKARPRLAHVLAFEEQATLESARRLLAASAAEVAPAPENLLQKAMAGVPNPKVGADQEGETSQTEAARILAFIPATRRVKQAS